MQRSRGKPPPDNTRPLIRLPLSVCCSLLVCVAGRTPRFAPRKRRRRRRQNRTRCFSPSSESDAGSGFSHTVTRGSWCPSSLQWQSVDIFRRMTLPSPARFRRRRLSSAACLLAALINSCRRRRSAPARRMCVSTRPNTPENTAHRSCPRVESTVGRTNTNTAASPRITSRSRVA